MRPEVPLHDLSHPIAFEPVFQERVWGGRRLESLYGKQLPRGHVIGESWEIVDRPEAQSIVRSGPLKGHRLHELWGQYRKQIFGADVPDAPRFPLLVKLLDAEATLSVQVHPPAEVANDLGGEAKTEAWYITHAEPGARIFAGLRQGVTRGGFEHALHAGQTADELHSFDAHEGDCVFLPSGRIHAIGGGNVIVEVMQNSDTTYRVFDWNRAGLDGRPRKLHLEEAMRSIHFEDFSPGVVPRHGETRVECRFFRIEELNLHSPRSALHSARFAIFTVLRGKVECDGTVFQPGDFFLVPACFPQAMVIPVDGPADVLRTTLP